MAFFTPAPHQRIVDVVSGEILSHVVEVDPVVGRVRRFQVEDDVFVRDADGFVILDEAREIRLDVPGASTGVVADTDRQEDAA
jgi:hypothetical protein